MRWPWQHSESNEKLRKNSFGRGGSIEDALTPSTFVATAVLTTILITSARLYRTRLKRIPTAPDIPASYFHDDHTAHPRKHTLLGVVVRISDGDGFRLYHTPGGRLAGWGWLRSTAAPSNRRLSNSNKNDKGGSWLADNTLNVRFSGIDAPELAHFGHPAQPGAEEATEFLKNRSLRKWARIHPHTRDQYGRVVATVFVSQWHIGGSLLLRRWKDSGAEVVKAGWATVYEGKYGAMFGGPEREKMLRTLEHGAKQKQIGIWKGHSRTPRSDDDPQQESSDGVVKRVWRWLTGKKDGEKFESPRDFKTRMKKQDEEEKGKT